MAQWVGVNATRLAWETKVETASQRLVLLAIAKYADQDGTAFPSVESLCADTCLNRKTAFKVLKELQEIGAIVVSKRQANNGNCYSICGACPKNGTTKIGTTKNGTPVVPKTVHEEEQEESKEEKQVSCSLPAGSSAADLCPSVDEFGLTNDLPVEAPKPKKQTKTKKAKASGIDFYGLSENLISDWKISRGKAKITQTVVDGFKREAGKAGIDLDEAVRVSIERGWRGFKAEWLTNHQHGSQKKSVMEQTSFADLDYSEGINPDGTF